MSNKSNSVPSKTARKETFDTVEKAWEKFHDQNPQLNFDSFHDQLDQSCTSGRIELLDPKISTFRGYLKSWTYGFRFWTCIISVLFSALVVFSVRSGFPLEAIRWISGSYLILFIPGYALTWALFPSRGKLSGVNRLGISIAMSLFLAPAIGMILNYTPIGIRPKPVAIILTVFSLIFLTIGASRELRVLRRI